MKNLLLGLSTLFALNIMPSAQAQMDYQNFQKVSSFSELQYPFAMKEQALSGNVRIAYADEGKGSTTLLFVHGLGSYAPAWKKQVEALSNTYRCIAVDLPGYGKSSKYAHPESMTFFADKLAELADSLGLDEVVMVGHSMGGQISMVTALRHPDLVQKLVLVAPAGIETFTEGEKEWFRRAITPKGVLLTPLQAIETNLATNFYHMPDEAWFMVRDRYAMTGAGDEFHWYCNAITRSVQGMVNEPVYRDLPSIKQPTLVVMGASDRLIPNRYLNGGSPRSIAEEAAQLIPDARALVIKKAGHFVMFEQAEKVNEEIRTFLGGGMAN